MWIILSFLTALFEASKDALCKRSLKTIDSLLVAWAWKALTLPFLIPLLFTIPWPDNLSASFWTALIIGGMLNIVSTILYIEAIKSSDLSITLPLLSFTPVFLLGVSPLLVNEYAKPIGALGVFLVFLGTYTLNIKEKKTGYLVPIQPLFKERGPKLMLGVAAMWSITANMDKIGVVESSPIFWSGSVQIFISIGLSFALLFKKTALKSMLKHGNMQLGVIGLVSALGLLCQMEAISIGLVPYVISIKRTSILFGVIFGWIFFREEGLRSRLTGSVIMVSGVFLVTLGS